MALLRSVTSHPGSGRRGMTFVLFLPLLIVADRLEWRAASNKAARETGFPLATKMIIGITADRLIIWSARWRWRLGSQRGAVRRDQVSLMESPPSQSRWPKVRLMLPGKPVAVIRVPASAVGQLTEALSGGPALG